MKKLIAIFIIICAIAFVTFLVFYNPKMTNNEKEFIGWMESKIERGENEFLFSDFINSELDKICFHEFDDSEEFVGYKSYVRKNKKKSGYINLLKRDYHNIIVIHNSNNIVKIIPLSRSKINFRGESGWIYFPDGCFESKYLKIIYKTNNQGIHDAGDLYTNRIGEIN